MTPLLLAVALATQTPNGWTGFVRAFDAYAASDSVVGSSVVYARGGRVVAHHEQGFGDRARGERVDERSIFHYGSITKTLTAVAIMQLRDRGLISLDDPVTRWVPELRLLHNPFGSTDAITIRMLLSHSAGLQNPTWPYGAGRPWEPFEPTRWEQLVAMMPYQEVMFSPGSRYSYSNPAFIYLARIIEAVTGDPYQSYIYKNLWMPLGMSRSYFGASPYHLADQRSNNYTLVRDSSGPEHLVTNGREFDPGITIPNGGWNAPLADLVTWVAFLSGAAPNEVVLRRGSIEEMWRGVVPIAPGNVVGAAADSLGLSFFLTQRRGVTIPGHTGHQAGFRSFLYLNPRTRDAVIAVFNTANEARGQESGAGWTSLISSAFDLLVP
jgi:CubicO group peptidase (beta-lactamase class C family)